MTSNFLSHFRRFLSFLQGYSFLNRFRLWFNKDAITDEDQSPIKNSEPLYLYPLLEISLDFIKSIEYSYFDWFLLLINEGYKQVISKWISSIKNTVLMSTYKQKINTVILKFSISFRIRLLQFINSFFWYILVER